MRLRTQLLFVSVLTLALPWAGCQYVREFESALRQSQQDSLADGAGAIAAMLAERPGLLVRDPVQLVSFSDSVSDIYAVRLPSFVTLDGFVADWGLQPDAYGVLAGPVPATYAAGLDDVHIWLYVNVTDDEVQYETPVGDRHDAILIDFETPAGLPERLLVATAAPGRTLVRRHDDAGWQDEPRAQAVWEENSDGYQVEIRLRGFLVGARLGLTVVDSDPGRESVRRSSSFPANRPGQLLHRLAPLEETLADFRFGNRRIVVTDAAGWVIAAVGDTRNVPGSGADIAPPVERLLRRIVQPGREPDPLREARQGRLRTTETVAALAGRPEARWYRTEDETSAIVVAAHPIEKDGAIRGAVVLEQASDAILTLTDRALTRLVSLTLFATLVAALGLLGFATYLSIRIQRLSRAAEQAVSPEGRISESIPGTAAPDELGDLSRNFAGLLGRLREHTDYLRSLAGKLSHELRTPLAVVQSSLDNLEAAELSDEAAVYAVRAREGARRLHGIIVAMSEASRVEQAIEQAEPENFDLRDLVAGCVNAYRDVHTDRRFELSLPERPCPVAGVGELLAQMLDKLVDNAVDFSPAGGRIEVELTISGERCLLGVANEGPPLPAHMQSQLFDSMISVRKTQGDTPHLGFGLYIARLIAESHAGTITACNLDDDSGARFSVSLPLRKDPGNRG